MKGTLLGFTWNNIHSSSLGLVRISGGSEFTQNLLPTFSDYTVDRPGADGKYYYGSKFDSINIDFTVAFNGLTDAQLRIIKTLFSDKNVNFLTFDESPYKSYRVHIASPPQISYNNFTDNYNYVSQFQLPHNHNFGSSLTLPSATALDKVYKGTMSLSFISYDPFAINRTVYVPTEGSIPAHYEKLKYQSQFINGTTPVAYVPEWKIDPLGSSAYSNVNLDTYNYYEWKDALKFKNKGDTIPGQPNFQLDMPSSSGVAVYNPSDFDLPFSITFLFNSSSRIIDTAGNTVLDGFSITTNDNNRNMTVGAFKLPAGEVGIRWNGKLQLLEGITNSGTLSGRLYNRYISSGKFFTINKTTVSDAEIPTPNMEIIHFSFGQDTAVAFTSASIDYDYKYL